MGLKTSKMYTIAFFASLGVAIGSFIATVPCALVSGNIIDNAKIEAQENIKQQLLDDKISAKEYFELQDNITNSTMEKYANKEQIKKKNNVENTAYHLLGVAAAFAGAAATLGIIANKKENNLEQKENEM